MKATWQAFPGQSQYLWLVCLCFQAHQQTCRYLTLWSHHPGAMRTQQSVSSTAGHGQSPKASLEPLPKWKVHSVA
ncbi:hypothetical protein B0T14DRAFT_508539 [Immersiella caudata]|uniref:Uncharacterized protein n=1 Tax=Immersiella caudata TaxID=314043 RepID=A0AA39XHP4_9PEZI|nr:hypothetical protein B0T14DRAFT_508539 [Immersiella caudata]